MPYIADDAFISLRYSQRLIDGLGLTWNSGIPVEGYSNLLWTLLMAGFGFIGANMEYAARAVGYLLSVANMYFIINYVIKRYRNPSKILFVALFFYSMSGTVAIWTIGGLEQPLAAFLALLATIKYLDFRDYNSKRSLWLSSIALGLLCITRPDGVMLSVIIGVFHLITNRRVFGKASKSVFILAIFPLIFYFGQLIFRIYYYGELVPNTALVKLTPSFFHSWIGLKYTLRFFKTNIAYTLLLFGFIYLLFKSKNEKAYLLFSILGLWFIYLSFIGGDIFEGFRHHLYTSVFVMLLLAEGINSFLNSNYYKKIDSKVIIVSISFVFLSHSYQQFTNNNYRNVKNLVIAKHLETLAHKLKLGFEAQQPLIAVDAAGVIPYVTEFPSLDMLGLNDYYIARQKPKDIGKGFIGHEFGDPDYTLEQNPDIIIMHLGLKNPVRYIDSLLYIHPKFQRKYQYVGIHIPGEYEFNGYIWFNKFSHKVGVDSASKELVIPGYLFNGKNDIFCQFNHDNELVLPLAMNEPASFELPYIADIKSIETSPSGLATKVDYNNNSTIITVISRKKQIALDKVVLRIE